MEGNAFYQQELQRRMVTPPSAVHPAFRPRAMSDPPSPLIASTQHMRESTVTTMSTFVNAGKGHSPLLKLVPSDGQAAQPTNRGYIEERHEQQRHGASSSDGDRTPVYTWVPTPKLTTTEFVEKSTAAPKKTRTSLPKKEVMITESSKSPKRSIFGRLRMSNLRGSSSPYINTLSSAEASLHDSDVPVKAQAVLGASPSKTNLTRSPSKRKGLFASRKSTEAGDVNPSKVALSHRTTFTDHNEAAHAASTRSKTPQTAVSDPLHYRLEGSRRIPSQTLSEQGRDQLKDASKCVVHRSQSLKYLDSAPPPTPPAKDTPPDVKARQQAEASKSNRVPVHQAESTPSKTPAGIISTNPRLSPTRFGSYGHKEMPTLITKPSVYSLHASVVPELTEPTIFEEMKARIDGLGLEGFNLPPENFYHHNPEMVYSPSVYSGEWNGRPQTILRTPLHGHHFTTEDLPTLPGSPSRKPEMAHHPKESGSSGGTIGVYYPELAKDPSVGDMTSHLRACPSFVMDDGLPNHGRTHSLDHSNSPRDSTSASLFAMPIDDNLREANEASSDSFTHQSAIPSPLHYLPATVYVPPPLRSSSRRVGKPSNTPADPCGDTVAQDRDSCSRECYSSGSPLRSNYLLDTAPVLQAQSRPSDCSRPCPSINGLVDDLDSDVDPKKPQSTVSSEYDKQDQMLEMLNKILMRNSDIEFIRAEMRATNTRLDERLAAIESFRQRASPPTAHTLHGMQQARTSRRSNQHRIPTSVADDFYRQGAGPSLVASPQPSGAGTGPSAPRTTESDTIADLRETNRRLVEMVSGFVEKLEGLEMRVNGVGRERGESNGGA